MASSAAPVRFGPFEVLSRIGVGGMGEVFRARLPRDGETLDVALKVLLPEYAREARFRDMFAAEARIVSRLKHPNIVQLIDFGEVDGALYLAMELVDGEPLSKLIRGGPWPAEMAAYVALEVLAALDHAHGLTGADGRPLDLVHRDVSATNVLVSTDGRCRLVDFGVAKASDQSLTRTGEVKGKLGYMAPEQLVPSSRVDARADLFSLGVLLYKLVHGVPPFEDVTDWLRAGARLEVSGPLADVIARALEPAPEARYPSAAEMAADLRLHVVVPPDAARWVAEKVRANHEAEAVLGPLDQVILSAFGGAPAEPDTVVDERRPVEPPVATTARTPAIRRGPPLLQGAAVFGGVAALVGALAVAGGWRPWRSRPLPEPEPRLQAAPAEAAPRAAAPTPPEVQPRREPVARPEPARRTAPKVTGYLSLDTEPWSSVYLGGRRLGTTPFLRVPVPPGKHRLELDVKDSGRKKRLEVRITPGDETRKVVRLR